MRLVLKMPENLTTSCGIDIKFSTDGVCGVCLVFDDYDKAVEYAGDPLLVKRISIVD